MLSGASWGKYAHIYVRSSLTAHQEPWLHADPELQGLVPILHLWLSSGAISNEWPVLNCCGFAHSILLLGITSLSPLPVSSHVDPLLTLPVSFQHMEPHSSPLGQGKLHLLYVCMDSSRRVGSDMVRGHVVSLRTPILGHCGALLESISGMRTSLSLPLG